MSSDGVARSKDGVPQWNGDPALFQAYEEESLLWVETQAYHKRHMCVPKLKAELTGPAKRLVLGQAPGWGVHADGVKELMNFLRQRLGRPLLSEFSELLLKYFRGTKRKPNESVNDYVTRKCEAYVRAQQSLQRVTKDRHDEVATLSRESAANSLTAWNPWGRSEGRRASWDSTNSSAGVDGATADTENRETSSQAAAPTAATADDGAGDNQAQEDSWWRPTNWWQGGYNSPFPGASWNWNSSWYSEPAWAAWSAAKEEKSPAPELIPSFLQGWFLLQDSGLNIQERNTVQTALRGDYDLQRVAAELRAQWPESELAKRDRNGRGASYMGEAVDLEEDLEAYEADYDPEDLRDEGMTEEGLVLMDENEGMAQEAMAAIQQGKRTLKEARARQTEVRLSRRYYKTGPGNFSSRGPRFSSGARGASSGGRSDADMTCLRCGKKGHRAANCPDNKPVREEAKHAEETESAPFVCYVSDNQSAMSVGPSTWEAMQTGKAVVDGGATRTIASVTAIEALMRQNRRLKGQDGILNVDRDNKPTFSFGNSSTNTCISTASVRLKALGRDGQLQIHTLDQVCRNPSAAILTIPSSCPNLVLLKLVSQYSMPSLSSMNKADLVAEIRRLGGQADVETRKLELQQQLITMREEQGEVNVTGPATKQQSDYQRLTSELTKASSRKAQLVKYMKEKLGLNVSENSTVVQLTHQAMGKIYDLAVADASDPVGFGAHGSLSYAEVQQKEPEYCQWGLTTSKEGQANPRLHRLAQWLSQQNTETPEVPKPTKWKTRKEGYQKTMMSSSSVASSSEGTTSSPNRFQIEMMEALQALRSEVAEMQADRRSSRPRRESHLDEEMESVGSFQKVSTKGHK
ncbi:hypothetical protein AK812_SmicGene40092 [Symbiodinium microadriaticum]|uniref:CCHC-type domain-containing protein n=1 Tax=Symbiodinium microadriaticum TaxID=2951 RepID=A0A1Q9C9L6_SYMMI|nr:hypothetical protein AK812_SmicGene40092 [Symbiodinium microadriaticum]